MRKWVETVVGMDVEFLRLALGATMYYPVADLATGNELIAPYIRFPGNLEGVRDILLQINRPRISKCEAALSINRLAKWGVATVVSGKLQPNVAGVLSLVDLSPPQFACTLELDINTAAEYSGPLPNDKLVCIFGELFELAEEIVSKGDVP